MDLDYVIFHQGAIIASINGEREDWTKDHADRVLNRMHIRELEVDNVKYVVPILNLNYALLYDAYSGHYMVYVYSKHDLIIWYVYQDVFSALDDYQHFTCELIQRLQELLT